MATHPSRRHFLHAVAAGTILAPARAGGAGVQPPRADTAGTESGWAAVRDRFLFTDQAIPMNAANLCPAPRDVVERWERLSRDVDIDCSFPNRRKFSTLLEDTRHRVAAQIGASPDEVALVRNTSEANNIINHGLSLATGDQVVVWDQNHPTNNVAWEVRGARGGFEVVKVATPTHPTGPDELVGVFERALTPRTRVLALSHVSNTTGVRLPVAELGVVARRRGIFLHIDGAQGWGALNLDVGALGCSAYTASAHKWFCGPREVGLLYVRSEHVDDIWPGVVGANWGSDVSTNLSGARRFESLGQRDDAALAALGAAADFHDGIGLHRTEARVTVLARRLKEGLVEAGYELITPMAAPMSAGVCIARVAPDARARLLDGLYEEFGIAGAATGGLRLCPHVYNTPAHVDRAVEGALALRKRAAL